MSNGIGDVLHSRMATIGTIEREKSKPIVKQLNNCKGYQCTPAQVDLLVNDATAAGVTNLSNNGTDMRPWYCMAAYKLGAELFMRCVSQAKEGRNPKALFSYLITQQLKKLPAKAA